MQRAESFYILRASDHKTVAWKNGKGVTAEIAICPESARFPEDAFSWRLSSAPIRDASPFSLFPGYERFLTLIEGRELELVNETRDVKTRLIYGEVHRFSGSDSIRCRLPQGAVRDLGLIFDPETVTPSFEFLGPRKKLELQIGQTGILFNVEGSMIFEKQKCRAWTA